MNYMTIEKCSVVNGTGIRTVLFVSGCTHNCNGCHNKIAMNFKAGQPFGVAAMQELLGSLDNDYVSGLTISGGDPLHPKNVATVADVVGLVVTKHPSKTIWVYTGYTLEELHERNDILVNYVLNNIDVLVDGRFVEELKDPTLEFRGSSNQRILKRGVDF